jgi:hypothetical protein
MTRAQKIVLGLLIFLLCTVSGVVGTDHVELVCSRGPSSAAPCQVVTTSVFSGQRRFPSSLAEVREERRVNNGKSTAKPRWAVVLLDRRGAELAFGYYDSLAEAAVLGDRVRAFVREPGAAPFRVEDPRGPWPYLLLVAAAGAAVWTVTIVQHSRGVSGPTEPLKTRLGKHWGTLRWFLALVSVAVVGQQALMWHADRTQGWLIFEAESRCTFDGGELLPGASMRLSLHPGRYCARVFNPSIDGHWETQCFDVAIGQTTTVRCRPSPGAARP